VVNIHNLGGCSGAKNGHQFSHELTPAAFR
jgi:hypothetical protein